MQFLQSRGQHLRKGDDNRYWQAFLYAALAATCIFVPLMVVDGGFFRYAGDFNSQQISFYTYMNAFVKEGGSFSWATDLGSGALNTYSYYLSGSPFFWLSALLPQAVIPFMMAPMLILKIGVAGGGAYLYLKRYAKNQDFAVIAACLYALSGFTLYNVFFNSFVDVIALFPYLLWALDAAILDEKYGWFGVLIAVNFINNYFFFVGQVLFICIYFFCKLYEGAYRLHRKMFAHLAVETLLGAAMGMLLAWPAFLSIMQNPRTVNFSSGYGFLMYNNVQQYFAILFSWILPPDSPYLSSMWSEGVIRWTSMTTYLPVCSLAGVLAYWNSRGSTWVKRVLGICAFCALVPVLNSAFYALNSSYYARWYYMPMLLMALATMKVLENTELSLARSTRTVAFIMLGSLAFALVPVYDKAEDVWSFGELENPEQYYMVLFLGLAGLALFAWVNSFWRGKVQYPQRMLAVVLAFSCVYGLCHISVGKFGQWENDSNLRAQYFGAAELAEQLPDTKDYRVDTFETQDNLAMWMNMSGLQHFNTTVAPSILSFYPSVGVKRDVSSKPEADLYALRSLLGVRYTIMPLEKEADFLELGLSSWVYAQKTDTFVVYENQNLLPMAYAYDYYLTKEQFEGVAADYRGNLLLRGIMLSDEQISALEKAGVTALTALPKEESYGFDVNRYQADVAARAAMACDAFTMTNTGFTTSITLDAANLVFFPVPYDDGFTATVNGEAADVWQVDNGLMAVLCDAGKQDIVFTYAPDGFAESTLLFFVGAVLYLLYLVKMGLDKRKEVH